MMKHHPLHTIYHILYTKFSKVLFFLSAILVALAGIFIYSYFNTKTVEAAWFDDNWAFRKAIILTDSAAETNKYAALSSYDASDTSRYQADCGDVRFTDQNGKLLTYTVTSCGASTTFDINIPSILNGTQTIYLYYGNPSAPNGFVSSDPYTACATCSFGSPAAEEKGVGPVAYWKFDEGNGLKASSSVWKKAGTTTNLFTNPSFETDFNWLTQSAENGSNLAFARSSEKSAFGLYSGKMTCSTGNCAYGGWAGTITSGNISLAGGDSGTTYTFSLWYYPTSGTGTYKVRTGNAAQGEKTIGTITIASADLNNWNRFSGQYTVPAGQTYNYFYIRMDNSPASFTVYTDGWQVEQSSAVTTYCDGSLLGNGSHTWSGTAHASTSTCDYGNDGELSGTPTWTTSDQCVSGDCLKFDGSDDIVTVTDSTTSPLDVTNAMTFAAWIRPTSTSAYDPIFAKIPAAYGSGYEFSNSSGTLRTTLRTAGGNCDYSAGTLTANTWQYVVSTYDGTNIRHYVNGVLKGTSDSCTYGSTANNNNLIIGGRASDTNRFQGAMDEIKIYNYVRSAAQIKLDYNSGKAGQAASKGTGTSIGSSSPSWMSNGLVGYWKMDEAAANSCGSNDSCDSSGNGNDGAWNGNVAAAAGKFGNGTTYDGTEDYTSFSDIAAYETSGTKTVSLWVKPATTDTSKTAASKYRNDTNEDGWTILLTNTGLIRAWVKNDAGTAIEPTSTYSYSANTWYNIAFTWDTNGGTAKLYVNGALHSESSAITGVFSGNSRAFNIGRALTSADGTSNSFNGVIDDVRIYNRVLTPKEVADLYNWAPGPVGYWNMDEGSGTSAFDTSGNGNAQTLGGDGSGTDLPTWTAGKVGKALSFDGTDDFVSAGDVASFELTATSAFSLSAWVKPSAADEDGYIVGKNDDSPNEGFALYWQGSTDKIALTSGATITGNLSSAVFTDTNTWVHIAATFNNGSVTFYRNGVAAGTVASHTFTTSTTSELMIGNRTDGAAAATFFSGLIDDVRVYNYARTQKQIVSDMLGSRSLGVGSNVSQSSPIGYWKFDEGADGTCSGGTNDACNSGSGGSSLDGAESGMAVPATSTSGWTNSGKFGKALIFDGTNDYINAGSAAALDNLTDKTISVWIYLDTDPSVNYRIVDKTDGSGTNGWNFRIDAGPVLTAAGSGFATTNPSTTTSTTLSLTTWTHVAAVFNSSTIKWSIYINGKEAAYNPQTAGAGAAPDDSGNSLGIGAAIAANSRFFDGTMDEVKIYNYALTADEVKLDMNQGKSLVLGALSDNSTYQKGAANQEYCVPGDSTSCASPVGEWSFNEGSGTSAFDTSGNGYTGTLGGDGAGTDLPTWTPGKVGKGLSFDGSNDYVKVGDATSLDFSSTGAFSVSAWIKTGTATGEIMVDSWIASAANNAYAFYTSSGTLKVAVSTMATNSQWDSVTGTTAVNDNKWHYVTLVYNNKTANLYVDGKLDVSEALTVGDATLSTDTYGVLMGANFNTNNSTFTTYQTGYLDEVKIYPYARSAAQIAWDYNRGGPVGWWKFDECQGTTAYDNSGNANNGTITIGASGEDTVGTCTTSSTAWGSGATGKFNSSLSFDGSDDYVSMASNIASYSSGSMMAWINSSGTYTGRQTVMGGVAASGADATARFLITMVESTGGTCSGNQWYTVIANGTTSQTVCSGQVYNSTNFPASTWTHVAITYDGSNVRFYKNGVLVNTVAQTASGAGAAQPFSIGRIGGWNGYYYQGGIDDARIYNYALTGTQIKNLYNGGFGIRFGPATGSP